jgi:anti-sigma factor RsiW
MKTHGESELISAFLDGALSAEEEQALREHISSCPPCREEHASLRATKSLLARAPRRAMPPDLVAQIEGRLARPFWKQVLDRLLPPLPVWAPAGAFAAAALVAVAWFGAHRAAADQSIPLEPLLAAHSRYTAEALVPPTELVAANYSAQLNAYYEDSSDQE